MTPEQAKEKGYDVILSAWFDGKTIQYKGESWFDIKPDADIFRMIQKWQTRIKPGPTYRPFKNAKEFEPFRDRWICRNGHAIRVNEYTDTYVWTNSVEGKTYQELFESYTFDDGTPCGIEVQDEKD